MSEDTGERKRNRRPLFLIGAVALLACCGIFSLTTIFFPSDSDTAENEPVEEEAIEATAEPDDTPEPSETSEPADTATLAPTAEATTEPTDTPTALPAATDEPTLPQVEVSASSVNIRSGPGTNFDSIGTAASGEVLEVLGRNTDSSWYNIKLENGSTGWVGVSVIEPVEGTNLDDVAEVATIPAPAATESVPTPLATQPLSTQEPPPPAQKCDPSYPRVCIPPPPPKLNCGDISERRFDVTGDDPHGFDRDNDGIGCES